MEENMRELEHRLNKNVWSHENRKRLGLKGFGLINFQSRIDIKNSIREEIDAKLLWTPSGKGAIKI
jgi:hypothetical protein